MKKILLYTLLLLLLISSVILYRAATDEKTFVKVEESGLVSDMYRYGDLYTHTNLPEYKVESALDTLIPKFKPEEKDTQLNVYILGDSYTQAGRVDAANLRSGFYQYGFDKYHGKLDTSKRNVLIFEKTERYLRMNIQDELKLIRKPPQSKLNEFLSRNPDPDIYNTTRINERLQYLVSNNVIASFLKESKARFNFSCLKFSGNHVIVSPETHLVYLAETLDSSNSCSPYHQIPTQEENEIIDYLNAMYDEYKAIGFDEIYFSPIPEKIRIYPIDSTIQFNHFYSMLQNPRLKMSLINCTDALKNSNEKVFMTCDTHWNTHGINVWLKMVDDVIKSNLSHVKK